MTNLGQHSLDIVHWCLGPGTARRPSPAPGAGSACSDNGETPDTQDALFEYPELVARGRTARPRGAGRSRPRRWSSSGPRGAWRSSRKGFVVTPDPDLAAGERRAAGSAAHHPVGGPARGQRRARPPATWTEAVRDESGDEYDQFRRHARDFLDCVKSRREPVSDLESSHRVATACHLANLSLRLGRKLRWDAERETIIEDPEAASWLERPYRPPWDAVRKGLGVG